MSTDAPIISSYRDVFSEFLDFHNGQTRRLNQSVNVLKQVEVSSNVVSKDQAMIDTALANIQLQRSLPAGDNAPWLSSGSYGKNGKPNYYFQNTPTPEQLWNCARNSPIGKRLTHTKAKDTYINKFVIKPLNTKLSLDEIDEYNKKLRIHLLSINYYETARICCGHKLEQGEAAMVIYRKGDGSKIFENVEATKIDYNGFTDLADITKEILAVEPISFYHYYIPAIGYFGKPEYYNMRFVLPNNVQQYFRVNPSRVLRWRNENIDYEQYEQISALRAVFSEIQIIHMIERAAGFAAHRWGIGIPLFLTQGATGKNLDLIKTMIGNPLLDSMWILPSENIKSVTMEGVQGTMLDLQGMSNMIMEYVAMDSQIPIPILMGRVTGVVEGGIVNERQYFNTLVREQSGENCFHRQFFALDPFIVKLNKEYNVEDFEFDWGLKQEMTVAEKLEIELKEASVASIASRFMSIDYIRTHWFHAEDLAHSAFAKYAQKFYNCSAEEIGAQIADIADIRQLTFSQILTTPEEKAHGINPSALSTRKGNETNAEQLQNPNNKPVNVERKQSAQTGALHLEKKLQWAENEKDMDDFHNDPFYKMLVNMGEENVYKAMKEYMKDQSIRKVAKKAHTHTDSVRRIVDLVNAEVKDNGKIIPPEDTSDDDSDDEKPAEDQ